MAKRDPEPEALDEEQLEAEVPTVGERLRAAREATGVGLEEIAAQTRIPQRHLASIETADWDNLPAPTYTIGFAKSYASAVGLDRVEIGNQLREEMGGQRFASNAADVFEPADPRKTMPKGLVIGAIVALILLVILFSWLHKRSLEQPEPPQAQSVAATPTTVAPTPPVTAKAPVAAQGPVVLTATSPVWLQISQKGGSTLFSGTLQPGQSFAVPASSTAPLLKTGKPEGLRVTVGNQVTPPVGPPATTVSNVSLLPNDLMKAPASNVPAAPQPVPVRRSAPKHSASAAPSPAPAPVDTPVNDNAG